jgi:hypothetical protein
MSIISDFLKTCLNNFKQHFLTILLYSLLYVFIVSMLNISLQLFSNLILGTFIPDIFLAILNIFLGFFIYFYKFAHNQFYISLYKEETNQTGYWQVIRSVLNSKKKNIFCLSLFQFFLVISLLFIMGLASLCFLDLGQTCFFDLRGKCLDPSVITSFFTNGWLLPFLALFFSLFTVFSTYIFTYASYANITDQEMTFFEALRFAFKSSFTRVGFVVLFSISMLFSVLILILVSLTFNGVAIGAVFYLVLAFTIFTVFLIDTLLFPILYIKLQE